MIQMETIMKIRLIAAVFSTLAPILAFANDDPLVTAFDTYCLKNTDNVPVLDRAISVQRDRHLIAKDKLNGQANIGYFMTSGGRQYLIEWSGKTCRVSTNEAFPNDVMKSLATNHILTLPHGDKTDFGRSHWFEEGHELTRYAFTHDLNDSNILLEYQKDDATKRGPVAITFTR
jgi:hypothetical protein